jgi:hypothetical protein
MDSSSEEEDLHSDDRAYLANRGIPFRVSLVEQTQIQQTPIYTSSTASRSVSGGGDWIDDDWYPSTARDEPVSFNCYEPDLIF